MVADSVIIINYGTDNTAVNVVTTVAGCPIQVLWWIKVSASGPGHIIWLKTLGSGDLFNSKCGRDPKLIDRLLFEINKNPIDFLFAFQLPRS